MEMDMQDPGDMRDSHMLVLLMWERIVEGKLKDMREDIASSYFRERPRGLT